jgi:hypothetical protein
MASGEEKELLRVTQAILTSVLAGDYATYAEYTDEAVTCFEPEALGHLVKGLPFHKFYFDVPKPSVPNFAQTTLADSSVRFLGDSAACVAYVRLNQKIQDGKVKVFFS